MPRTIHIVKYRKPLDRQRRWDELPPFSLPVVREIPRPLDTRQLGEEGW
jgi:hypothetical protein